MAGCGSLQPVLQRDWHYLAVGPEQAKRDTDECRQQAEASGIAAGPEAGTIVALMLIGAAFGALGAPDGYAKSGAAAGAGGGAAEAFRQARAVEPAHRAYVDDCLRVRGYRPQGWE